MSPFFFLASQLTVEMHRMLGLEYLEFRGGSDSSVGEHKTLLETNGEGNSEWEKWICNALEGAIERAAIKARVHM